MTTKLDGPLKRELSIAGAPFTLTITPEGFKLVPKGKRKGLEMEWHAFLSGDHALATALRATLFEGTSDRPAAPKSDRAPTKE